MRWPATLTVSVWSGMQALPHCVLSVTLQHANQPVAASNSSENVEAAVNLPGCTEEDAVSHIIGIQRNDTLINSSSFCLVPFEPHIAELSLNGSRASGCHSHIGANQVMPGSICEGIKKMLQHRACSVSTADVKGAIGPSQTAGQTSAFN